MVVVFGFDGAACRKFAEQGIQYVVVYHDNWLRSGKVLAFFKNALLELFSSAGMLRLFNSYRPDLVYVNSSVSVIGAFSGKILGVPVIWHLREVSKRLGGEIDYPKVLKDNGVRFFEWWYGGCD